MSEFSLDLQATPKEQDDLLTWAKEALPFVAQIHRLRLDAEDERPGLRIRGGPFGAGEAEVALRAEGGALVLEFEAVRQKVIGASKISPGIWWPRVVAEIGKAQATLPKGVGVSIDDEPRFLRVSLEGWRVTTVLISEERLILKAEND